MQRLTRPDVLSALAARMRLRLLLPPEHAARAGPPAALLLRLVWAAAAGGGAQAGWLAAVCLAATAQVLVQ